MAAAAQNSSPKVPNGVGAAAEMFSPKVATATWRAFMTVPAIALAETLRFAGHRLEAQAEFVTSLLSCKDPGQALEAQSNFMRDAVAEYGREAEEIVSKVRSVPAEQARAA